MAEDIFVRMYEMQQQLQSLIPCGVTFPDDKPQWTDQDMADIRTQVLGLTDELHEFLRETRWKPWTKGQPFVNPAAYEELTDVFLFFMNIMILMGMTPHDLLAQYLRKHLINTSRHSEGAYAGNVIMKSNAA